MSSLLRSTYLRRSGIKARRQEAAARGLTSRLALIAAMPQTVSAKCPFPDPPKREKPAWLTQRLMAEAVTRRFRRALFAGLVPNPDDYPEWGAAFDVLLALSRAGHLQ